MAAQFVGNVTKGQWESVTLIVTFSYIGPVRTVYAEAALADGLTVSATVMTAASTTAQSYRLTFVLSMSAVSAGSHFLYVAVWPDAATKTGGGAVAWNNPNIDGVQQAIASVDVVASSFSNFAGQF